MDFKAFHVFKNRNYYLVCSVLFRLSNELCSSNARNLIKEKYDQGQGYILLIWKTANFSVIINIFLNVGVVIKRAERALGFKGTRKIGTLCSTLSF